MPNDTSPITGSEYYSGTWIDVRKLLSVLDIGEGELATLTQKDINEYQETVDRAVDDLLTEVCQVPLVPMNQKQPDGTTKKVLSGELAMAARWWTAGLILMDQFQQLESNITDQAQQHIDKARRDILHFRRPNQRLYGQRRKSNLSRTMPPGMQPPMMIEEQV